MTTTSVEERLSKLEQKVEELAQAATPKDRPARGAWRQTIGMFANDPVMDEIIDGALQAREQDRLRTCPE